MKIVNLNKTLHEIGDLLGMKITFCGDNNAIIGTVCSRPGPELFGPASPILTM